jgi:hypothetical protein
MCCQLKRINQAPLDFFYFRSHGIISDCFFPEYTHRKKILQYGLGEILLPIIRRVIF